MGKGQFRSVKEKGGIGKKVVQQRDMKGRVVGLVIGLFFCTKKVKLHVTLSVACITKTEKIEKSHMPHRHCTSFQLLQSL